MKAIVDNCPNIQSLSVSYLTKVSYAGVRTLIQKCHIVELEVAGVDFGQQQLNSIVTSAKN